MTGVSLQHRLRKAEARFASRIAGAHRYSDDELVDLIAWLEDPRPEREAWAVALLQRERLIR